MSLKLASRWEKLSVVRRRFRIQADWVHIPKDDDDQDLVTCTQTLQANWRILYEVLEAAELQKVPLALWEYEVLWSAL